MTSRLAALLTIGALLIAPACSAQTPSNIPGSGQGGYLGVAPGAAPPFAPAPQGQQLGAMPGANLGQGAGARTPAAINASSPPAAFCDAYSIEPGRCRSRAEADHEMCAKQSPDRYLSCRRTLDLFGWRL